MPSQEQHRSVAALPWRVSAVVEHPGRSSPFERTADRVSISKDGSLCASSHRHGVLDVYSCSTGKRETVVLSHEVGSACVTFTHHPTAVLEAATTQLATRRGLISYRSLWDNTVLRFFKFHQSPVQDLAMHPSSDTFLSSDQSGLCTFWDLRNPNPIVRLVHNHLNHAERVPAFFSLSVTMWYFPDLSMQASTPVLGFPAAIEWISSTQFVYATEQDLGLYDQRNFDKVRT